MKDRPLNITMLSIHSSPMGELGTKNTGGMSVYIRELAKELGKRGHIVDIYTRLVGSRDTLVDDLYPNVRLIHLKAQKGGRLPKAALYPYLKEFFNALDAFKQQERLRYDLIHSHYWLSGKLGQRAQRRWGTPHLVMFHTLGAVKNRIGVGKPEPAVRISSEQDLMKSCHRVLVPTEREKENLLRYYAVCPEKIGVVPCGVNLEQFYPADPGNARRQLGFCNKEAAILYVGRFDPLKGLERLISALSYLKVQRRVRLIVVGGDGPRSPEVKRIIRRCRDAELDGTVQFIGTVEHAHLPPYYSAADLLVVPSYYESFGLVGLEALACGIPVVATRTGVLESIIREGKTGRVVANDNPIALARGIEAVLSEIGLNGVNPADIRETVASFSWSNVAEAIVTEYEKVLHSPHTQTEERRGLS